MIRQETSDNGREPARTWLLERLGIGGALARAALRSGAALEGELTIVAGRLLEPPHYRFAHSAGVGQAESDDNLGELLGRWFMGGDAYLVVEDDLARPDDAGVAARAVDTFSFETDVFHYLLLDADGLPHAPEFIRGGASGYPTIAFVVAGLPRIDMTLTSVDEARIDAFGSAVVTAIVSAYDDEGYVVWRKANRRGDV